MERQGDANTSALPNATGPHNATGHAEETEEYFNSFADNYLLGSTDLTGELADVEGVLGDPGNKLTTVTEDGAGAGKDGLLSFEWDATDPDLRTAPDATWNVEGMKGKSTMGSVGVDKSRVEPGDSSEWDQTHSSLPLVTQTDSPESVLRGRRSRPGSKEDNLPELATLQAAGETFGQGDAFLSRYPMGTQRGGIRNSLSQPHMGSRFPEFPMLDPDPLEQTISTPTAWDRRGPPPETSFYASPIDNEWRHPGHRGGFWGGEQALDPLPVDRDSMRSGGEPSMYRMRSDLSGQPFRGRYHSVRRQYSAELPFEYSHGRGGELPSARMDGGQYDHGGGGYSTMQMGDGYGRMMRPSGAGAHSPNSLYSLRSAPIGDPGLEGSRKRTREAYLQPADVPASPQQPSSAPRTSPRVQARMKQRISQEEQLISSLKRQIMALDPSTKNVLKESLYRISRNTNARASGMGDTQQHRMPTRNSFVDRVVANLMYNRFQSPMMRSGARQGSGGWVHDSYGGSAPLGGPSQRIGGSPGGGHMGGSSGLHRHLDESPLA